MSKSLVEDWLAEFAWEGEDVCRLLSLRDIAATVASFSVSGISVGIVSDLESLSVSYMTCYRLREYLAVFEVRHHVVVILLLRLLKLLK